MNLEEIENKIYELMLKAKENNEVPVSALVIKDNKIVAENYNKVNSSNNILDHAEILVIKEAAQKLNNWRLSDCELYISLEPCNMCKEVIEKSRFKKVIYFSKQNNEKINKKINYEFIDCNYISSYLTNFFKDKR